MHSRGGTVHTVGIVTDSYARLRFCSSPFGSFVVHDKTIMEEPKLPELLRVGDCVEAEIRETPKYLNWAQRNPIEAVTCRKTEPPRSVLVHLYRLTKEPRPSDLIVRCQIGYVKYDGDLECDVYQCELSDRVFDCDQVVKRRRPCIAELKLMFLIHERVSVFTVQSVVRYLDDDFADDSSLNDSLNSASERQRDTGGVSIQGSRRGFGDLEMEDGSDRSFGFDNTRVSTPEQRPIRNVLDRPASVAYSGRRLVSAADYVDMPSRAGTSLSGSCQSTNGVDDGFSVDDTATQLARTEISTTYNNEKTWESLLRRVIKSREVRNVLKETNRDLFEEVMDKLTE